MLNDKSYFAADDGIHGVELWTSDGTDAGTALVKILIQGALALPFNQFLALKANYTFLHQRIPGFYNFWQSDGTEAGTKILIDSLNISGENSFYPPSFTPLNSVFIFYGIKTVLIMKNYGKQMVPNQAHAQVVNFNTSTYSYLSGINNLRVYNGMLYLL